jgi:hypothetical protein
MLIKRKKCCRICGTAKASPHHITPIEEGGVSCTDNIVWLCEAHHNIVEASPYNWTTCKQNIEALRRDYLDAKKPKRKDGKVHLDSREIVAIDDSWEALRKKRIEQGYLEPEDSKKYQAYWMESEAWERLWGEGNTT